MDRRKIIRVLTAVISASAASWFVNYYFFSKPSFDKRLIELANEINKTCPMMVDNFTRLDNTTVLPDKVFQYNYTLTTTLKSEVDTSIFGKIKLNAISNARTNPDMKDIRDNDLTLSYYYKDKNGVFISKFNVTPNEYK